MYSFKKKAAALSLSTLMLISLLASCGSADAPAQNGEDNMWVDEVTIASVDIGQEALVMANAPAALSTAVTAIPSGTLTESNDKAVIDYSNTKDGYVMVNYTGSTTQRLKVQVKGPSKTYTYDITPGVWNSFPLTDNNGSYSVGVFENVSDSKYASVISKTFSVAMTDEFAPFTHSNQYVNYDAAPSAVAQAAALTSGIADPLQKVEAIYDYVVGNFSYDTNKAATVTSGYLPVLDSVMAAKSGICFDYAALMTGMLRSQGVPCKLVIGYVSQGGQQVYHAWISVWSNETGWVDGAVYFENNKWQRMDPTFASSANKSESVMQFIGDGNNYVEDRCY